MGWSELLRAPLGDYQITKEIARGGTARVFEATSLRDGSQVALKVMSLGSDGGDLRGFAKRFEHEARAVELLNHPNIVKILATGETDEFVYIAMQLVTGGTFRSRLGKQMPIADACDMAIQMAHALSHAHMHKVIHRDVKPANMLIDQDDPNHILLADFGIAKIMGQQGITKTGTAVGTPEYMAPEQAKGEPVDPRADIYGLACVLYEALAGRPPFVGPTALSICYQHVHTRPAYIRGLNPEVPRQLALVIEQALAKTPADRFRDAEAFAVALHPFTEPSGSVPRRSGRPITSPLAEKEMRGTPDSLDPLGDSYKSTPYMPAQFAEPIPPLNQMAAGVPMLDFSDRVDRSPASPVEVVADTSERTTEEITPMATSATHRPRHTNPNLTFRGNTSGPLRASGGPLPGALDLAALSTIQTPASPSGRSRSIFVAPQPNTRRLLTLLGIGLVATLVALLVISHGALSTPGGGTSSEPATAITGTTTNNATATTATNPTATVTSQAATATTGTGVNPTAALAFSGITLNSVNDSTCDPAENTATITAGQPVYLHTCVAQGYGPGAITFIIVDNANGAVVNSYTLNVTANPTSGVSYSYHTLLPAGTFTAQIKWNGQLAKSLAFTVR